MEFNLREYHTTNTFVFGFQATFLGRNVLNKPVVKLVNSSDAYSEHFLLIVPSYKSMKLPKLFEFIIDKMGYGKRLVQSKIVF